MQNRHGPQSDGGGCQTAAQEECTKWDLGKDKNKWMFCPNWQPTRVIVVLLCVQIRMCIRKLLGRRCLSHFSFSACPRCVYVSDQLKEQVAWSFMPRSSIAGHSVRSVAFQKGCVTAETDFVVNVGIFWWMLSTGDSYCLLKWAQG